MSLEQATEARLSEIRDILRSGAGEHAGKAMREEGEGQEGQGRVIGRHRGYSSMYPELQKYAYPRSAMLRALDNKSGKIYDNLYRASKDVMEYHGYMGRMKRARGKLTEAPHSGRLRCKHCHEMHTKSEHRFHGKGSYHRTHLFAFGGKMENPGKGRGFLFFGSFTSKLAARRKEAQVPGAFIRESKGRYYVMKARQATTRRVENPPGRAVLIYGRVIRVIAKKTGPHNNCDAECKRCNHEYFHDFKAGAVMYGLPDGSILIKKG